MQLEKSSLKAAPFTQYYKSVHDKAALRTLWKNEKMRCSYFNFTLPCLTVRIGFTFVNIYVYWIMLVAAWR